ncbi:hypothetical protein [Dokdonella sp.]|mgnify:CR=1 FL=1|uniref:hypothetical protein n=1 Tax=Dokdonella sp. TaxID=2291710 RepID=UPI0031C8B8A2|nr:hypothetical protein [Dokdonella sp.]
MTGKKPFRIATANFRSIQHFARMYACIGHAPELDMTGLHCSEAQRAVILNVDRLGGYPHVSLNAGIELRPARRGRARENAARGSSGRDL